MSQRNDNRIPLGPKPDNPADAWRVLTPQAKQALQQKRTEKQFGGTPGQAPTGRFRSTASRWPTSTRASMSPRPRGNSVLNFHPFSPNGLRS